MKTKYKRNSSLELNIGSNIGLALFPKKLSFFGNILKIGFLDFQIAPVGLAYTCLRLCFYIRKVKELFELGLLYLFFANYYILSFKIFDFVKVKLFSAEGIIFCIRCHCPTGSGWRFCSNKLDIYKYASADEVYQASSQKGNIKTMGELCGIYLLLSPLVQMDLINFINFFKKTR